MRALGSVLAAVLCLLGVCGPEIARAQDMSQVFAVRVCNYSGVAVSLAMSTMISPSDTRYHVYGWYTLNQGCFDLGYAPRPWLYFYAEEFSKGRSYKVWRGNFPLCVAYPGPFDWIHTRGLTCDADSLKDFTETRVDSDAGIFVLNLR